MDYLIYPMEFMNITQIASGYGRKNHGSHPFFEIDNAGRNTGIDFAINKMKETGLKCVASYGSRATGNTRLFWTVDPKTGYAKKVRCADGTDSYVTIALTHSWRDFRIGKIYGYNEVFYQEGTAGYAEGNHIHMEACKGLVTTKVEKKLNGRKYYVLANMMDVTKLFCILDGFTTVINSQGLKFKHVSDSTVQEDPNLNILTTTANLNLRQNPSTSAKVIRVLKKGTKVNWYWEQSGKWYKVYIPALNTQGWVHSDYLR